MTYYFFIEIFAPNGLAGIEPFLKDCKMPLTTYFSGFNNKVILRGIDSPNYFLSMETSIDSVMIATGEIYQPLETVFTWLNDVSTALSKVGFPHKIMFDDNKDLQVYCIQYQYPFCL